MIVHAGEVEFFDGMFVGFFVLEFELACFFLVTEYFDDVFFLCDIVAGWQVYKLCREKESEMIEDY